MASVSTARHRHRSRSRSSFDFINGFHDAANSIATVVSTRVLSPRIAVLWAAFFNFVALFIFAPRVADTIAKIVAHQGRAIRRTSTSCSAGLVGAIIWDLLTWWCGLPTSSSHALIGGVRRRRRRARRLRARCSWDKLGKTLEFIFLAPLHRLRARLPADARRSSGCSGKLAAGARSTSAFRTAQLVSAALVLASATAATTRRRRWASSWRC